jgi:hypothetical protein
MVKFWRFVTFIARSNRTTPLGVLYASDRLRTLGITYGTVKSGRTPPSRLKSSKERALAKRNSRSFDPVIRALCDRSARWRVYKFRGDNGAHAMGVLSRDILAADKDKELPHTLHPYSLSGEKLRLQSGLLTPSPWKSGISDRNATKA